MKLARRKPVKRNPVKRERVKRQRKGGHKPNRSSASDQSGENYCHFLRIPAELRLRILKEALSQPEPVHEIAINESFGEIRERNFNFAPAILRCCRQLYAEGIGYLYDHNIFDILIFSIDSVNSPRIVILNHDLDVNWIPPELLKKARHFNITLRGKRSEYPVDQDDSWDDLIAVHQLCAILVETIDLAKTTMTINVSYEQEYEEDNEICDSVLEPFASLRGLASVKVSGVTDSYAREIESRMMSDEPLEKIWKMKTAFLDWCDRWTGDPETTISDDAVDMINYCDISSFKKERARLVEQLGASRHRSTQAIYQYDVEPKSRKAK